MESERDAARDGETDAREPDGERITSDAPSDADLPSPAANVIAPDTTPAHDADGAIAKGEPAPASVSPAIRVQRRPARYLVACALAIVAFLAADLATKRWAEGRLSLARVGEPPAVCAADASGAVRHQRLHGPPLVLVDEFFELEYAENCGAAFGLLRQAPGWLRSVVFDTAAIAASVVLLFFFASGRGGPYFAWSVPFVVSGAVGNLVDRVSNGYVVDFIHVHYGTSFDYPTFNVADIAITIGVALLVIDGFQPPAPESEPTALGVDANRAEDREVEDA